MEKEIVKDEVVKEEVAKKDETKENLGFNSYTGENPDKWLDYLIKMMATNKKSLEAEEIDKKILALQSQINTLTTEILCQNAKIDVLQSVVGK